MAPRIRSVDITGRNPEGKPLRGKATLPGKWDHEWELDEALESGVRFKVVGRHPNKSFEDPHLARALLREVGRSEKVRRRSEKRKAEQMKNWPLFGMPRPGQVVKYGPRRQAYTLPPEEYAMAL
ncbi:MAG: hypothetical protein ABJZ75_08935, partial [Luteolibacter sp.]